MLGVMPKTWGRDTGGEIQQAEGVPEGAKAQSAERSHWRAGCREIGLSGSGRGGWKRVWEQITHWPPTSHQEVARRSLRKEATEYFCSRKSPQKGDFETRKKGEKEHFLSRASSVLALSSAL